MSNNKYDVIGLMKSGIPYAASIANNLIQGGNDVRFFAYYPSRITLQRFLEKQKEFENYSNWQLEDKIDSLEYNDHKHLNSLLEFINALSKKQVEFQGIRNDTYASVKSRLINNFWIEQIKHKSIKRKVDYPYEEFIKNKEKRLTQEPDPSRIALICDNYYDDGDTLCNSVYDLFSLGYVNIEVNLEMSSIHKTRFKGNLETFRKSYQNKNPMIVGRDILK